MKTWERVFAGAFGALLLSVGIYALALSSASLAWQDLGGSVLCALGINAIYCALTRKRSWISKIGPLP